MKLSKANAQKLATMFYKHGTAYVASRCCVTKKQAVAFRKEYLWDWSPNGNRKSYLNKYFVYDDGRIWSRHFFRFMKPSITKFGYWMYNLEDGNVILVHRLVLTLFKRPPKSGEEARHYRENNPGNNHVSNLRWGTSKQNNDDRARHGTDNKGERHGQNKMPERHVKILRKRYYAGERSIAKRYAVRYGMNKTTVYRAITGRTWRHL